MWLKYFNPLGTVTGVDERQEFLYWRTTATTPDDLGDDSADGNSLGPGLCTYDANSETGVLLVITTVTGSGAATDIVFSLHATGVHP